MSIIRDILQDSLKMDQCVEPFGETCNLEHTGYKPCQYDGHDKETRTQEPAHSSEEHASCFRRDDSFNTHMQKYTEGKISYDCDRCDRRFSCRSNLETHFRTHTGERPFQCDLCQKKFGLKVTLERHMMTHTGEQPYQCVHCLKQFGQISSMYRHMKIHKGEKPYLCELCAKRFAYKISLETHLMTHTGEKPYECSHCDKRFALKSNMMLHVRTHTGERPYQCDQCLKSYSSKGGLVRHMGTHPRNTPYQVYCQLCHKGYDSEISLTRHICVAEPAREIPSCHVCHKVYRSKAYLARHIAAHAGDEPYEYVECFRENSLDSDARTHPGENATKSSSFQWKSRIVKLNTSYILEENRYQCEQHGQSFEFITCFYRRLEDQPSSHASSVVHSYKVPQASVLLVEKNIIFDQIEGVDEFQMTFIF